MQVPAVRHPQETRERFKRNVPATPVPTPRHAFPLHPVPGQQSQTGQLDLDTDSRAGLWDSTGRLWWNGHCWLPLETGRKSVTYNDLLRFNYQFGLALIENSSVLIRPEDSEWALQRHSHINYPSFVQNTFQDIYFTDAENRWIDQTIHNIAAVTDPYRRALLFFALAQACLVKRPYNLFHRKNLYLRFAKVERSFGNKASWTDHSRSGFEYLLTRQTKRSFRAPAVAGLSVGMSSTWRGIMIWSTSIRPIFHKKALR